MIILPSYDYLAFLFFMKPNGASDLDASG